MRAYLHQDFDLDSPDWESIVDIFKGAEPTSVAALAGEIGTYLALPPEDRPPIEDLGCSYRPPYDQDAWLADVRTRLLI